MLRVQLNGFHLDEATNQTDLLGFSIDKTVSDTLNPYIQDTDSSCILDRIMLDKDKAGIILFILDFKQGFLKVKCSKNVKSITILEKEREKETGGALSDEGLFRPKRDSEGLFKRNLKDQDVDSMFKDEIVSHYLKEEENKAVSSPNTEFPSSISNASAESWEDKISSSSTARVETKPPGLVIKPGQSEAVPAIPDEIVKIPLTKDKDGFYETSFYIYILNDKLEGLYR